VEHTALPALWQEAKALAARIDPKEGFNYLVEHRRRLAKPVLIGASGLYLLSGFYVLGPDEVGVVERFGKKILPYKEPGLHYKLSWPMERLTRIQARKVRVIEFGFRSGTPLPETEPAAYEWNAQHRSGRFQRRPEESLMLSGDQNMLEVTATVHYRLKRPDDYLFNLMNGEETVRAAVDWVMQEVVTTTPLDDIFTTGRKALEKRALEALQRRLDRYQAGVEVLQVRLLDVHPSLEVVDAFRDVSGAYEEKNRMINEAEGYRYEQVALARGNAEASIENAKGYTAGKKNRAAGDASRFTQEESAYRTGPAVTRTRLYLETMEQVLANQRKMIVDSTRGRRHLTLLDDGIGFIPAVTQPAPAYQAEFPLEEEAPPPVPPSPPEATANQTGQGAQR